jgi:hypothetical protein
MPLAERICPFVTNSAIKEVRGPEVLFPALPGVLRHLEPELRPEQQMTKRWFDRVLFIQVAASAYIQEIDIQRSDVVMVGKVLRLDTEDKHTSLKVKPC